MGGGKDYIYKVTKDDIIDYLNERFSIEASNIRVNLKNRKLEIDISEKDFLEYILERALFEKENINLAKKYGISVRIENYDYIKRQELVSSHGYYDLVEVGISGTVSIRIKGEDVAKYRFVYAYNDKLLYISSSKADNDALLQQLRNSVVNILRDAENVEVNGINMNLEEIIKCYKNPDYPGTIRRLCEEKISEYISK